MSILLVILGFLILIYSIILHEIAHGWMADKLGDPTARLSGRLTLNPRPHIDPLMSIALPLILLFTGSPVIFGAAKPVPIDPFNFRDYRKDTGLVGLAGPATNLILAIIAAFVAHLLIRLGGVSLEPSLSSFLLQLSMLIIRYNLVLAALNIIPIPPLDGSRILAAVLPKEFAQLIDALEPYGFLIIFFLLFFPLGGFSLNSLIFSLVSFWLKVLGF